MRFSTFLLAILLFACSAIYAQTEQKKDDKINTELTKCLEKTENQTTMGMCDCTYKALEQWDKRLNEIYKKLLNKLDTAAKNKLKEAQRQWITFKEKETELVDATYGAQEGTMWRIVRADKVMNITRQRAVDLEAILEISELE